MAKDLWKKKQLLKKSKPLNRGKLTLYLDSGTWNLILLENADHLIEIYEEDDFHFPGPLVTEKDIPSAIQAFLVISNDLLNKI